MKLFISADMEGTASVCSWAQVDPSNTAEYPLYRRYMMREVAAAIEGARSVLPCEILIRDSHWDHRNLLWDELPTDIRAITGGPTPLSMNEGIDSSYSGAFFTGYHGAAGCASATLSHTYSPETIFQVSINGTPCSEAILNAALIGYYGVPLLLISGDRAVVDETTRLMPWVTGAIVKDSIGYYSTNSLTPAASCELIRDSARRAVSAASNVRPFTFEPPIELTIQTMHAAQADFIELLPGFERRDGRTVRYACDNYVLAFRAFLVATRLGAAANAPA
ncbi:MAG: M55 family metallopeptidase [Candidatus Eremiobacteraeota bacterium]|nr:M55 family metallopeptidase [Candidatus Eremiobacteraeota bacterium]